MNYCNNVFFDSVRKICLDYLTKNYDYYYLSAMHRKNGTYGADTIIVGSSHSMNAIIEKELSAAGDAIQFSISSQDLYYDFEQIKKAVREGKRNIKRCMINLGYYVLYQDLSLSKNTRGIIPLTYLNLFDENRSHNWKEAKREDLFADIGMDEEYIPKDVIHQLCEFWAEEAISEQGSFYGALLSRDNNNALKQKGIDWSLLSDEEREAYTKDRVDNGHNKQIEHTETRVENGKILSEMVSFLYENNIKIYFFVSPFTESYLRRIDPRFKADILDELNNLPYPVEFLDMNDYSEEFGDDDFLDPDHVNLNGAHKATALLNSFICVAEENG